MFPLCFDVWMLEVWYEQALFIIYKKKNRQIVGECGEMCNFTPNYKFAWLMQFIGNIEAKLDAKGRVFLPASFRKCFEGEIGRVVMRKEHLRELFGVVSGRNMECPVAGASESLEPLERGASKTVSPVCFRSRTFGVGCQWAFADTEALSANVRNQSRCSFYRNGRHDRDLGKRGGGCCLCGCRRIRS